MTQKNSPIKGSEANKDALQQDLHALIGDAEKLLQHAANLAGDQAEELRKSIQSNLQRARETLGSSEAVVWEQVEDLQRASESYVQKNPLQAIGIAVGIGLLIGLLLRSGKAGAPQT